MAHTTVSAALLHLAIAMSLLVGVETCMSTHPVSAPTTTKPKTACAMCTNITVDQPTVPAAPEIPVTYAVEADSGCRTATVKCSDGLMPYIVNETTDPEQLITAQDLALKCTAATMWEATYSAGMTKTSPKLQCAKECAACANIVVEGSMKENIIYDMVTGCRTVKVTCSDTLMLFVTTPTDPMPVDPATEFEMICSSETMWEATYMINGMATMAIDPTLKCGAQA